MSEPSEPLFAGKPAIPSPEVFERARRSNPAWYNVMEQALSQFAARPESRGIYPAPEGKGATIAQIWMTFTLLGVVPYCVLVRPLPARATERIERLVRCSAAELITTLKALQAATGQLNVPLSYHDGVTGHCIRLTAYDERQDRFIYHDPWPERSLLAAENNAAGVDARPEAGRWSITADELTRVAFAVFFFPSQWLRTQGEAIDQLYPAWRAGKFFNFFRLQLLEERADGAQIQRVFSPQAFKKEVAIRLETTHEERIKRAALNLNSQWTIQNFSLALDLIKSFIACFAPTPDRERYLEISRAFWKLRDPHFLLQIKGADPKGSDAARCIHAFMGSTDDARVSGEVGSLTVGTVLREQGQVQHIEYDLY